MTGGEPPHRVDRPPIPRSLEQQHTWSLGVVRIVLDDLRCVHTFDKFPRGQPVSGEFVVSVRRYADAASGNQRASSFERVAHNPCHSLRLAERSGHCSNRAAVSPARARVYHEREAAAALRGAAGGHRRPRGRTRARRTIDEHEPLRDRPRREPRELRRAHSHRLPRTKRGRLSRAHVHRPRQPPPYVGRDLGPLPAARLEPRRARDRPRRHRLRHGAQRPRRLGGDPRGADAGRGGQHHQHPPRREHRGLHPGARRGEGDHHRPRALADGGPGPRRRSTAAPSSSTSTTRTRRAGTCSARSSTRRSSRAATRSSRGGGRPTNGTRSRSTTPPAPPATRRAWSTPTAAPGSTP